VRADGRRGRRGQRAGPRLDVHDPPARLRPCRAAPAAPTAPPPARAEQKTVLAVDDDASFLAMLERCLGKEGFSVVPATAARTACNWRGNCARTPSPRRE